MNRAPRQPPVRRREPFPKRKRTLRSDVNQPQTDDMEHNIAIQEAQPFNLQLQDEDGGRGWRVLWAVGAGGWGSRVPPVFLGKR